MTEPFFEKCLQITPRAQTKSEIQSLVCGSSLSDSTMGQSWKNLGLIHILVVSGGHLSILAAVLVHILRGLFFRDRRQKFFVGAALVLFSLGNRLQPPVLRSLIEWLFRSKLERRGWRAPEIALLTTWIALPFSSTIFDLLSLALSFFASVTVEQTAKRFHRRPLLALVALQVAVWWILMPLLFTMGLPHPLTTMTNIVLAPLLGATLIPFAMVTWLSGALPAVSGLSDDPLYLGYAFDVAWRHLSIGVRWLAGVLPSATPKIAGTQPLLLGFEMSSVLMIAVFTATCALLIRARRERRRDELARSNLGPTIWVFASLTLALLMHFELRR